MSAFSVCVCVCHRAVSGAVALLHTDADVSAWQRYRPGALGAHVLCVVHLGRAHCRHSDTDGRTVGVPTHSATLLVCSV